jgi:hypothetical protein
MLGILSQRVNQTGKEVSNMGKKIDMALRLGLGSVASEATKSPHVRSAARALGRAVRETMQDPSRMVKAHPSVLRKGK